ncbi:hypothetical protein [Ideonella sp. BN130291]|uniref:hypothetical protein n=1 Tax=Ideonella sp. BN130291 TaxID=3112940 RepID=UPI002E26BDF6|nr:hypothetical protein [Ideonella sp. BN130291]
MKTFVLSLFAAAVLASAPAHAHGPSDASAVSALSVAVPVAVSVAGPVLLLSGAVALTVVSVQASAVGTVWVLERASDGARCVLRFGAEAAGAASMATGAVITTAVLSTGWLLSAAGEAIAFIPNEIGASLLYNERITR